MCFSGIEAGRGLAPVFQMHSLLTPPRAVNQLRISHNPGASEYLQETFQRRLYLDVR